MNLQGYVMNASQPTCLVMFVSVGVDFQTNEIGAIGVFQVTLAKLVLRLVRGRTGSIATVFVIKLINAR